MPTYRYVARDRSGKLSNGQLQAREEGELRNVLRANGLFLIQIKGASGETEVAAGEASAGLFARKPALQDLIIATRQLSTMLRAGMPMMETLELVTAQANKPALKSAFRDLERSVSGGESLSSAMGRYPKLFNRLIVAFVESGEATGNLSETLEAAAQQLDREDNLRRKVKAAFTYPKIVVAACVGTIVVMLTVVVPVFANVYSQFHSALPAPTLLLIGISNIIMHWWWAVIAVAFGATFAFRKFAETDFGKRKLDTLSLRLPLLGDVFRKIAIARFVQTLSSGMSTGLPVLHAMEISGNMAGNAVIKDAVLVATGKVRDGSPISVELEKTGVFPMMVTRMLAAGETSGSISNMLDEINRFYERDVEYAVDRLTRMIEPMMTVMVGGIVLLILLALYMPIFNLGTTLLKPK